MNNASLARIGTVLYALVIGFFGINHFLKASGMATMVPSFFKGGVFWVYLSGACLVAAALAFLLNKYTKLAGILLALFLLVIVFSVHLPAVLQAPDEAASRVPLTNLIKDLALAGAALVLASRGS